MKRTGEIVLTVIGLILNLFGVIGFMFLTSFMNTDLFRQSFEEGFNEGLAEEGMEDALEASSFLSAIAGFGWFLAILSLVGVVAGIIAIVFFRGNKKPKAASIILLISAVVLLIGTVGLGFLPFVVYLIAGIMGLVRKPPIEEVDETEDTITHY